MGSGRMLPTPTRTQSRWGRRAYGCPQAPDALEGARGCRGRGIQGGTGIPRLCRTPGPREAYRHQADPGDVRPQKARPIRNPVPIVLQGP